MLWKSFCTSTREGRRLDLDMSPAKMQTLDLFANRLLDPPPNMQFACRDIIYDPSRFVATWLSVRYIMTVYSATVVRLPECTVLLACSLGPLQVALPFMQTAGCCPPPQPSRCAGVCHIFSVGRPFASSAVSVITFGTVCYCY